MVLTCPQCGAPAKPRARTCEYCRAEFLVSSPSSLAGLDEGVVRRYANHYQERLQDSEAPEMIRALGLCYMELGLFDHALREFERCIQRDPTHPDAYLYASLAMLKGRRPRGVSLQTMEKIESYLSAARQLDNTRPEFLFALGLAKFDFYLGNGLRVTGEHPDGLIEAALSEPHDRNELETIERKMRLEDLASQYL